MGQVELFNYFMALWNSNKTIVSDDSVVDSSKPSQQDKPSPHSSFTTDELWKRVRKGFPEDTIRVFEVANTNSMEPMFDDNCQVITEQLTLDAMVRQPLVPGDIVIYKTSNEGLIIHRLMEWKPGNGVVLWLIKGDNNIIPDGWVDERAIKYRLVGILYGRANRKND